MPMGSSSMNRPVRNRMALWKMTLPRVSTRLLVTMYRNNSSAAIVTPRVSTLAVSAASAARMGVRNVAAPQTRPIPPRTRIIFPSVPSGRCQKDFKPCITGDSGALLPIMVSLLQKGFEFPALLFDFRLAPLVGRLERGPGLLQPRARSVGLRLHRPDLLLHVGDLFLFLLDGGVQIGNLAALAVDFVFGDFIGLPTEGGGCRFQGGRQVVKALHNRGFGEPRLGLRRGHGRLVTHALVGNDIRQRGRVGLDLRQIGHRVK